MDYDKAFDTIEHSALYKVRVDSRIDYGYKDIIIHVYNNAAAHIMLPEQT